MKPPHHPTASGDRRLARLLMQAMRYGGHTVELASSLRTWRAKPEPLDAMIKAADQEIALLTQAFDRDGPPDLWFTYHLYHKAPDLIGPAISEKYSLPYCLCEASAAPKHATGPWQAGYEAAKTALARADTVFFVNPTDRACLEPLLKDTCESIDLKPFLEFSTSENTQGRTRLSVAESLTLETSTAEAQCWIAVVGMMRPGVKSLSYKVLADSLKRISKQDIALLIMGDGEAAAEIRGYFGEDPRAVFLGALTQSRVSEVLSVCDFAAWPSIGEAFGYGLLEAQAAGLPVIAGENAGVANIVASGKTGLLCPMGDATALAEAMQRLIANPDLCKTMGAAAQANIQAQHSLDAASKTLEDGLSHALMRFKASSNQGSNRGSNHA